MRHLDVVKSLNARTYEKETPVEHNRIKFKSLDHALVLAAYLSLKLTMKANGVSSNRAFPNRTTPAREANL